jgi:SAM-dependent methyltransferase
LPQLLDLDAVIHAPLVDRAVEIAAGYVGEIDIATVLDIGAGTGVGTFALAAKYPGAHVVAVDVDDDMLGRVRRRAEDQKSGRRITTVHADIGSAGFDVGIADVIWSSNTMHEVPDPAAAFQNILRSLRRGGVLLVLEMDAPPSLLPHEHASLERALRGAAGAENPAPNWSRAIAAAGFDLLDTQSLTSDQRLPAAGPGGAYAALELHRLAQHALPELTDEASAEVRNLVTDLNGRHELLDHVHIRGSRTLWVARRP